MEQVTERSYTFGDSKYIQRRCVLGQLEQLAVLLNREGGPSLTGVIGAIMSDDADTQVAGWKELTILLQQGQLVEYVAVILIPEGSNAREKVNSQIAEKIRWDMTVEELLRVIVDFFACNMPKDLKSLKSSLSTLTQTAEEVKQEVAQPELGDTSQQNSPEVAQATT